MMANLLVWFGCGMFLSSLVMTGVCWDGVPFSGTYRQKAAKTVGAYLAIAVFWPLMVMVGLVWAIIDFIQRLIANE